MSDSTSTALSSQQLILDVILAVIAATPAVIASLLTMWTLSDKLRHNTETTERVEAKTDKIDEKADLIAEKATDIAISAATKAEQIHVLVNSNLTQVKQELELANVRAANFDERIEEMQKIVNTLLTDKQRIADPPLVKE
jgi:hypothetical protein